MAFTANSNTPLALAVWLAHDSYDNNDDPLTISATEFNKSIRQYILGKRVKELGLETESDIASLLPSRIGTAIHDAIEAAWGNSEAILAAAKLLGYPKRVATGLKLNPDDTERCDFPVYMEKRISRKMGMYTITGKFDMVLNGALIDFKTMSAYAYQAGSNTQNYIRQGSIYRWIDNGKYITEPMLEIAYVIRDFSAIQARTNPNYPQAAVFKQTYAFRSNDDIEKEMHLFLQTVEKLKDAEDNLIPLCTDEELWLDPPTYKYYKNPEKRDRSTKNFDNLHEAEQRRIADGSVGVVVEVKSQPRKCNYCDAKPICKQYEGMANLE